MMIVFNMRKKERIELVISGILIAVLLFLLPRVWNKKETNQFISVEENVSLEDVPVPGGMQDQGLYTQLEEQTKNLEFKRDPFFRQSLATTALSQELYLNGIVWDEASSTAIINNQIVAIGSEIQGKKVVDIMEDMVILEEGEHRIELMLK